MESNCKLSTKQTTGDHALSWNGRVLQSVALRRSLGTIVLLVILQ
jgi:hypothetical protein